MVSFIKVKKVFIPTRLPFSVLSQIVFSGAALRSAYLFFRKESTRCLSLLFSSSVVGRYSSPLIAGALVMLSLCCIQGGGIADDSGYFQERGGQQLIAVLGKAAVNSWHYPKGFQDSFVSETVSPSSSLELISTLKVSGMWHASPGTAVAPLVVKSFPSDLGGLEVSVKKKVFLNSLLPAVLMAMQEVQGERAALKDILAKLPVEPNELQLPLDSAELRSLLSVEELAFLGTISRKYRSRSGAELLKRIDVLPVSLVMAQGALESSWGTSRFARLGNNIFGMWTWEEKGIVPLERKEGLTHKLAAYDSILDSVRAYILTINRLPAYAALRELRGETMDPINLATGLLFYSERREGYIRDLQSVINYNALTGYDRCRLTTFVNNAQIVALRAS